MDVATFYALFSATCFTLVGLWWNVVQSHPEWTRDPVMRRTVGGIYLSFFLPALMGLFAQVGGIETPQVWRASFVVIALVGGVSMVRLLATEGGTDGDDGADGAVVASRLAILAVYVVIAVLGTFPELADVVGLQPIQVAACLLIILVALGHGLVWRFMTRD